MSVPRRGLRLLIVSLPLAGSFAACERSSPNPPAAPSAAAVDAGVRAPAEPAPIPPTVAALFPAKAGPFQPPADAGPARLTSLAGPALEAVPGPLDDIWTLPQTPKRIRWVQERPRGALEVRLVDGAGMPWPARIVRTSRADAVEVEVVPLSPFATGSTYQLVAELAGDDRGAWTVSLQVQAGVDGALPWEEPPPKRRRR